MSRWAHSHRKRERERAQRYIDKLYEEARNADRSEVPGDLDRAECSTGCAGGPDDSSGPAIDEQKGTAR